MEICVIKPQLAGIILFFVVFAGCKPAEISNEPDAKEFTVRAFRYGYSPDVIEVSRGDNVSIIVANADTIHGIRIPDLGLRGNYSVNFTAGTAGEYEWYCNVLCGEGHKSMKGRLIIR